MRPKAQTRTRRPADADKWFHCIRCAQPVVPEACGTAHRNHCPWCLWSRHIDDTPGDRAADCGGAMEPIAVWVRPGGDWSLIHRCRKCGEIHSNRIAGDDNELALLSLAVRPISQPPFPLERLQSVGTPLETA
ncbi:MAG TPA: RNHCP domain-containing protein [Chthonomonadaceae bacterium]|nr:RNHCP domain-containing protein [Chthonomonadaceae bacterium]